MFSKRSPASPKQCFRIRDVLIRIRIVTLVTDRDPDPDLIFSGFKMSTKITFFFKVFFCLFTAKNTFSSVFKEVKNLIRSHKTVKIEVIHNFLLVDGRIRIRTDICGSGWPKILQILRILILIQNTGSPSSPKEKVCPSAAVALPAVEMTHKDGGLGAMALYVVDARLGRGISRCQAQRGAGGGRGFRLQHLQHM
jgi:hypothetical protein